MLIQLQLIFYMISKPQTSQEILWCQAHWAWWLPPLTCSVQLPGSLPRADFTTSSAPAGWWLFSEIPTIKGTRKAAVLPLPVCAHTCHEIRNAKKRTSLPTFFNFCVMSWVWAPCWCIYLPSKMAMENSPLNKKNPVTLTIVLDYQIRRTMTSLPDKAAGAECFCTFAWKGPKKKHNGKFTQLQCTLFHSHCTIIDIQYTVFSRSVYLTILHFQDFFFIDSASLVALEAAAGVGLSYLKLHLSIVNFCCAHLPLSIVDALDTTGRQFLRMSTRICRERFLPAPSQGYCECEHATHLKSGSAGPGAWWTAGKFLGKNRKSPGTRLWAAQFRLAIDYGNLESSYPFRCSFQRHPGDPKSSVMEKCWRRPCIWWYKSSGFQCYLLRVEYLLGYQETQ